MMTSAAIRSRPMIRRCQIPLIADNASKPCREASPVRLKLFQGVHALLRGKALATELGEPDQQHAA
jgi:hypothetical protein